MDLLDFGKREAAAMLDRNGWNSDYDTASVRLVPFVASVARTIRSDLTGTRSHDGKVFSLRILTSPTGVNYLPDEGEGPPPEPPRPRPMLMTAGLFFLTYVVLHLGWNLVRDTAMERALIGVLMVEPTLVLVNLLTPALGATAKGATIVAGGRAIEIVGACTGMEMHFMMVSAFLAFPLPWRSRLLGIATGVLFVFAMNEARILVLFYAYLANEQLFGTLHGTVVPIVLIVSISLFFLWWTRPELAGSVTSNERVSTPRI